MGNCWSCCKPSTSAEMPNPPSMPPSVDSLPSALPMDSSPPPTAECVRLSPSQQTSLPSPPMDPVESIRRMCEEIDIAEQIDLLITFLETQRNKMKNPSEAASSSSDRLQTAVDVTSIGAKAVDTICTQAEKLKESELLNAMGNLTVDVMKRVGELHWAFLGLSVAAFVVQSYLNVGSAESACRDLLEKILELAKYVKQYGEQMRDGREKMCCAVSTIVEGCVVCLGYLNKGKFMRFWSASNAAAQLEKTDQQLKYVMLSLDLSVDLEALKHLKQLPKRLDQSPKHLLDFKPVGIEEQVREVKELLDMEGAQSALAVIVCGFGGLGKSTLAASVVQSLDWSSTDFKFCRVIIDDTKPDRTAHIKELQQDIIYDLGGVKLDLRNPDEGRLEIGKVLEKKCCLLFIDNVVEKDSIRDILPKDLLSGQQTESEKQKTKLRILLTSRQKNVKGELNNINCKEYDVNALSDTASQRLLLETILQSEVVEDIDEKGLISDVASECKGVPLLLSVFGKHLRMARDNRLRMERDRGGYLEALHDARDKLKQGNLDRYGDEKSIGRTLMFVYDKIEVEVQQAFMDICVYFRGWEWKVVADIVDSPTLEDLRSRMLVSKTSSGKVFVHDILQLMGKTKAGLTRFSDYNTFSKALEDDVDGFDVKEVKGIFLVNNDNSIITIQSTQLEAMHKSLRLLMLDDWVTLEGPLDKAFTKLRYLDVGDIAAFPFKDPSKLKELRVLVNKSGSGMNLFHLPANLRRITHEVPEVECDKFANLSLQNLSSLKSFIVKPRGWNISVELPQELRLPASLLDLELKICKNLPKHLGHLTALESFIVNGSDLESLPQRIGKLTKLKHLSMNHCSKLASLSEELGMLSSLEALSMTDCPNLIALPESLGGLHSLQTLELSRCKNLKRLPDSLGGLLSLQTLDLSECKNLHRLPETLGGLLSLQTLGLRRCKNLQLLPESLGGLLSLQTLELCGCENLQRLPESFGALRIQSLKLHSLNMLQDLPNSFGNMPLLKDFSLISCGSLMSLPNSFVQLKMLETLVIRDCNKLSVLPQYFSRLGCLKHMTVVRCPLLKELPHGFGALSALKTFYLDDCNSFVELPSDFTELTCLEELRLMSLPLISIPDGFGKLKTLRVLYLKHCSELKTLSDDFENMATMEELELKKCPELDGSMMEKILKLQNCYKAHISGSTKLVEKWEHLLMQGQTEHMIVVKPSMDLRERERVMRVALLHGECMEVKNGQLMERSSLLEGLEEGLTATLALIMLPHHHLQPQQHQIIERFVEMAIERAETNGSGKLQIVCARKVDLDADTAIASEEEEEGIRQILVWLPKGSCAIPSSQSKRIKLLSYYSYDFLMADVVIDVEGRKNLENLKFTKESVISEIVESGSDEHEDKIRKFMESICGAVKDGQSQSEADAGESKTMELMEVLKSSGIHSLLIPEHNRKVMVDDLEGKIICLIISDLAYSERINLQQIYKGLQQKDSNFIGIWFPIKGWQNRGHGSYTRLIQCMPWATFPDPRLVSLERERGIRRIDPCFVILDEHGQIANHDALPLLLAWDVNSYPFTQSTIQERFFSMESESCVEFLLHEMNIVGRKPMKSKMTFLYAEDPQSLQMKSKLEELTQIDGSFEVLYVGKFYSSDIYYRDYKDATQHMLWPSLSFSDMIMFWERCMHFACKQAYELYKESNIMMGTLHELTKRLYRDSTRLVVGENGGVVTCRGEDVLQLVSKGEGRVRDELMESLRRGECSPLVKTFFKDEIHNHPLHPQHPLTCYSTLYAPYTCDVCGKAYFLSDEERPYRCDECHWDMCASCWLPYAKQEVEEELVKSKKEC